MWGKRRNSVIEAGMKAPAFHLKTLNGTSIALQDALAKGPVLLAFFKIGCPVCQLTFPYLERLAGNPAVQILGVSQDNVDATKLFNQRFGVTFPTLLDECEAGYPTSNAYGISSVPSVFLVEPDGSVSKSFSGFSKRDLEALGARVGVKPFRPDEKLPDYKPG